MKKENKSLKRSILKLYKRITLKKFVVHDCKSMYNIPYDMKEEFPIDEIDYLDKPKI